MLDAMAYMNGYGYRPTRDVAFFVRLGNSISNVDTVFFLYKL